MYKLLVFTLLVCCGALCGGACSLAAAELKGVVVDPSGRPAPGARVAAIVPSGVITEQITDDKGAFDIYVSPLYENVQLRVIAAGFQTATVGMGASHIQLAPRPRAEAAVSTVTSTDLRDRNEAQAEDLMRETPGVQISQSGPRGGLTDLFVRGSDSKYNLVLLDGIPIDSFALGGSFDFAHMPSDLIEEIDIARGPQSALYGSYAMGSVVDLVTRAPENGAAFDALAEGGTHDENRVALSGSGMIARDWGIAGSISSFLGNGAVPGDDYRNDSVFLSTSYRWRTQNFFAFGDFDYNDAGDAGVYTASRDSNNTSTYGLHWQDGITDNLRADIFTGFFRNNGFYLNPGFNTSKDLRVYGEGRLTWAVNKYWTISGGYAFDREEARSTYAETTNGYDFLLRRDDRGVYLENRILWNKFYIDAGLREEIYQTPLVPADAYIHPPRPVFPARLVDKLNPKIAGSYQIDSVTHLHASFGTGLRPPGALELALADNPNLQPERTESYDVGIERLFLKDRLSVDAAWFRNRYKDMIVSPGPSFAPLFPWYSGNLANARAEGVEASARVKPLAWLSASGNYMWLETAALAIDGGSGLYLYLGQPLLQRPKQSGSAVVTLHYGSFDVNLVGYFRGRSLDPEPEYAPSAALVWNSGYKNIGVNVNYRVKGNITVYANLRNALDERYEEVYGYPSPLLNVVAGVKWSLARAR